ncbi:CHAT domain-containing protein [Saccharopolyspora kobensis]|uniref:CHAT domain-containing protein n=1 Tax=Saccharopolyspora kobensis TaxID=146035 RepID=A0A1H5ZX57_9PSEU|nr:CHAT domain-containing protein [Saccharopolyspora kobensis]SEG41039.1 CHAT domain-containing protein [Saccharopolyspora kobensis]SFE15854.1 CHAT domain-containing protein [Saccharopolyspora kobensis]
MVNRRAAPDGTEVLAGLATATRPVARLTYVDADELYLSWVWDHAPAHPRMVVLPRALIAPALEQLRAALPSPLPSETGLQALERALGGGDFTDPAREQRLATALTSCVIPQRLGLELNALEARGFRPHLRVQPSPSIAQLPWELLGTSGTDRLTDMVDVSTLLPASLRNATGRAVSAWDPRGAVVAALDPAVPGFAETSELGSVLGPVAPGSPLAEMVAALGDRVRPGGRAFRRNDFGRDRLAAELVGASRFLYVGHVTASTHALDSRMHLSDGAGTTGHAEPVNGHRPLTAADVVLGHGSAKPLRAPNRVALVACESGGDLRFAEPTGLVAAFAHRGAEYVTATRWTLPTEAGLRRYVPGLGDRAEGVLAEAILAVNAAHESPDPVAALNAWQRAQAHRWIETGDPRCTPLIWAAFHTAWSPPPPEDHLQRR